MDILSALLGQVGFFLLIFARISGIFTSAPVFGSRNIPVYIKAGLSLILSFTLLPLVSSTDIIIPESLFPYVLLVVGEFLVGLIFGYVSSFIMYAVQMGGHIMDLQIGYGIINVFDPQQGQQIPLLGNFQYILALLVLLLTNGHHVLISALFSSFRVIPVTGAVFQPELAQFMVDLFVGTFSVAFKISVPILAALVLTDSALGILARTMPQMNIFVVGVPGKIAVGTFALFISLPFYVGFLGVGFNVMYQDIYRLLYLFQQTGN
ncbi:MAG: fliR: flagellar biosynthetic protein FliR [Firmicutes bacterium]|nr:fliR: flagellar biosynthetic protein FliR [Bacillota bacterium]